MHGAVDPTSAQVLNGSTIIGQIKQAGISHVLSVPDLHTSRGLLWPLASDPDITLIRVCKEDECLGIAAGLTYGDKRALILIQHTGFLYAMNAIRGVAIEQKLPICLMIGLLQKEPGVPPRQSSKYGLRIVEPILDAIGIPHVCIETDDDAPHVGRMIGEAWSTSSPRAILIGGRAQAS